MGKTYEVIIAGAGPVGLFLACELGMRGVSVAVLERDASPQSPWRAPPLGTRGLYLPSIEAFYRRGLLGQVVDAEDRPFDIEKTASFQYAGHFAGIMLDANKIDRPRWKYLLGGPALQPGPTSIERIESALAARAVEVGVSILRGAGVTGLAQEGETVRVQAGDQAFQAKWLVGCDGGRSAVRKAAGFEFVGSEAEFTGYVGLCELDDPAKMPPGFTTTPSGTYIVGNGNIYLMDFDGGAFDRSQPITREHFESVLRRVSELDVRVKALHVVSSFTDRCKQATTYRQGRVLLAGDAAHIHSPLGAQGLSTGISDAMNLGWKLAATVQGSAPAALLDTYMQERHPVGAEVLEWTRVQVATLRPGLGGRAVARLVRDIIQTNDGTHYFVDRIWGASMRYDLGDAHPLVGQSAPDFEFVDGRRLGALLATGRGLLVDFKADASLAKLAESWRQRVDYVGVPAKNMLGLQALLVRPDGVVAWAAEGAPNLSAAKAALLRWFGLA